MDLKEDYGIRPEAKRFAWRRGVLVTFDLEAKVTKPHRRLRYKQIRLKKIPPKRDSQIFSLLYYAAIFRSSAGAAASKSSILF